MIKVKEWVVEEQDLIRLFRIFIPYRENYGLELGFEKFFEERQEFCLRSGLDAIETTLLHNWKGKHRFENGKRIRYVKREHTGAEWQQKLQEYQFRCAYCHQELKDRATKDHIIPVSKGGSDKITNIAPACWHCNFSKRAEDVDRWQAQCGSV